VTLASLRSANSVQDGFFHGDVLTRSCDEVRSCRSRTTGRESERCSDGRIPRTQASALGAARRYSSISSNVTASSRWAWGRCGDRREYAVDVVRGVYLTIRRVHGAASARLWCRTRRGQGVLTSLLSWLTPCKPGDRTSSPGLGSRSRLGVTSMIWRCRGAGGDHTGRYPVNDPARASESMAIATSASESAPRKVSIHVPSRGGRRGLTCLRDRAVSSVCSPIAGHPTTTSLPDFLFSTMRSLSADPSSSDTEDPPYFCTTSATVKPA